MADLKIKQIKTSDNTVREIDAKYWGGHDTSDLGKINGKNLFEGDIDITAETLGLSAALKYCGITTTELTDGSTTNIVIIDENEHHATAGCVVFYGDKEFVFNGSKWELLGSDVTYKVVQSKISSPEVNGEDIAFIDTIEQDANGVITATKKEVRNATKNQKGVVKLVDGDMNGKKYADGQAPSLNHTHSQYENVIVKGTGENSAVLKNSYSTASGKHSIALGSGVSATGNYSFAEGKDTQATNTSSHAEGYETFATGKYSHSEGIGATASGEGSHAEGGYYIGGNGIFRGGQALGRSSHAEGYDTTASGEGSHAEGVKTVSQGSGSHAEGGYFIDSYNSVAGGQALGRSSHAEGVKTIARGDMSHVEGFDVEALGKYSHAEGGSEQEIKVFMPRLTTVDGEKCKYKTDLTQIPNNDSNFLIDNWIANIHYITDSGELVYDPQTSIKITSVIGGDLIYIVTDKEIVGYPTEGSGFNKLDNTPTLFIKYIDKPVGGDISYTVTAAGDASHAEGSEGTKSAGFASHAEGCHTFAGGTYSHSEGVETEARGFASHAEGNLSITGTYAAFSHAEGSGTKAMGARSHAEGVDTIALGEDSHAEGDRTQTIGNNSHAEGSGTKAIGFQSHAEGLNSEAEGTSAHAEGFGTFAKGARSHAEGRGTYAYSQECHAEGWDTKAGIENNAEINAAHAEGRNTVASGKYSHAEGYGNTASGQSSHAEGENNIAIGGSSHAEGLSTTASGRQSHSEGKSTKASGDFAHAEGHTTIASGNYSHSEGIGTKAEGMGSHAEGGYYANGNIINGGHAKGRASHAEGIGTITNNDGEHASGKYNKSTSGSTLFSVGNGTSDTNRKNAFEITSTAGYINGEKILTEQYRLEYTSTENLLYIQPCSIKYSKHEYNDETGKGVFIYNEAPTSIREYAFEDCRSLTSITIPDSVTDIGDSAFWHCSSLKSVTIPDSVTSIDDNAFDYCESLTSITIPDSVIEIGGDAFYKCNLINVYCKSLTPPTIAGELYGFIDADGKIYVPYNSLNAYKSATNWSLYADNMVGSEILSLSDDSLMSVSISLEERIKHLENIIEQIVITK